MNGTTYDGDFVDGRGNGIGKYRQVNGDIYEGEVRDGKGHGKGK